MVFLGNNTGVSFDTRNQMESEFEAKRESIPQKMAENPEEETEVLIENFPHAITYSTDFD